ncbi:7932_t:CDS:10 [Acaulospora colombiana]|uniref:7932_t:CDS:1 n=1 Tax=Acaulospora colombiana TaxID=27376 RepID=A0ACA9KGC0_9GLOM|nr:7932_t:CDS:10 [Acaulospora colombiana]
MFVDGTINGAVNNGTIGRVGSINGFIAGSSESKRDREKDLNNEIDNFFQSPSERQSSNLFLRKSEIEQDISNETGNKADHELQDDADSDLDTADNEEAIDDQEEVEASNDVKTNKTGPLRLSEANRREIDTAYNLMDKQYMWKLSSGKFVEEELYKLGKRLEFEQFIDNTSIPEVPELSNEIDEFLNKFLGKTNLNEIRQIIKESSFGKDYDHEKHHDLDYICLALHSLVREIQNGSIKDTNLENWYNCHVWSVVFDQAFGDIRAIAVVRGDWILKAVGNGKKDEFGAGEAGKDWVDENGTKYIREIGLKLPKTLKDMLVNLMERIKWNEEVSALRSDGSPDTVEKFDSVLTTLASVLNAKSKRQ